MRLVRYPNITANSWMGRLDIYLSRKWGTICGMDSGGAEAACRQLGFDGVISFEPYSQMTNKLVVPRASDDMPIAIGNVRCEQTDVLHVLRCDYSNDIKCDHDEDIVLTCNGILLSSHPYNSQVQLTPISPSQDRDITLSPSSGLLQVFLNKKWGYVCDSGIDKQAADTACRQMGYTNALDTGGKVLSNNSSSDAWLNGVHCGNPGSSCQCLNGCFKNPSSLIACISHLSLECTFNSTVPNNSPSSSGSKGICSHPTTCNGWSVIGIAIEIGAAALLLLIIVLVVCVTIPACFLSRCLKRKKEGYQPINS